MQLFKSRFISAETYEAHQNWLRITYQRVTEMSHAPEPAEFAALEKEVKSAEFQRKKRQITHLKFKETEQYRTLKQFETIKQSRLFRDFNTVSASEYATLMGSAEWAEITANSQIKSKRKKDEKLSEIYRFLKSKAYRNYKKAKELKLTEQFEKLKAETESTEFKQHVAYCEDAKRYEKSELFFKEQRYADLLNNEDLQLYLKYKDTTIFDSIKNLDVTFEEDFNQNSLNRDIWSGAFLWAEKTGIGPYSTKTDKLNYLNALELAPKNSALKLEVKKQNSEGTYWNPELGFDKKTFEGIGYILSSGKSFAQHDGIFEIKFNCNTSNQVHYNALLLSEHNDQAILIFRTKKSNRIEVGTLMRNGKNIQHTVHSVKVPELKQTTIISLIWHKNSLEWFANGTLVHKMQHNLKAVPMHLVIYPECTTTPENAQLNIELIKVSTKH